MPMPLTPLTQRDSWWLRADPVTFRLDAVNVYLEDNTSLHLSDEEQQALTETLNPLLASLNTRLVLKHPSRGYLSFTQDPLIETTPLSAVIGRDIRDYLPGGKNGPVWRRVLTEIQMALNRHPINQARAQQGLPLVNSLWFWDEGQISKVPPTSRRPWWKIL